MKSYAEPGEYNASVVKFDGIALPQLLLPPSTYDVCCFSCSSTKHIRLYLSVIAFLIKISNTFPCNFVQIDVFCQVQFVNQYESCSSISYYNC